MLSPNGIVLDAVAGAHHLPIVDPVGQAGAQVHVAPRALDAEVLGHVAVAGHQQLVGRRIVVRQAALALDADERRVVLVPQAEVDRHLRRHLPLVVDEREDPRVDGARLVDDREVTTGGARPIEQERGQRIADVVLGRGDVRHAGLAAVEGVEAARAALILRLQQVVAVVAVVAAELDGVVARQLGHDQRRRVGRLAAIPRQRRREADHRVRVALQVDRRHPARVECRGWRRGCRRRPRCSGRCRR